MVRPTTLTLFQLTDFMLSINVVIAVGLETAGALTTMTMITKPKNVVIDAGLSVELECQFLADKFNLFDYPVVWKKQQNHVIPTSSASTVEHSQQLQLQKSRPVLIQPNAQHHQRIALSRHRRDDVIFTDDLIIDQGYQQMDDYNVEASRPDLTATGTADSEKNCQVNMMGNLLEPFSAVKRYKATLIQSAPKYLFGLSLTDVQPEDTANYTCQVDGPNNSIVGSVTHSVTVRAPFGKVTVSGVNWTTSSSASTDETGDEKDNDNNDNDADDPTYAPVTSFTVTEHVRTTISCTASGGGPDTDIRLLLNGRELMTSLDDVSASRRRTTLGSRCMYRDSYETSRTFDDFVATADDDMATVNCTVAVAPGLLPVASQSVTLLVQHAPVIHCEHATAAVGQLHVELTCEVKARPEVSALYWMIDSSAGIVLSDGDTSRENEYWTTNMVVSESILRSKLNIVMTRLDSFRTYTIYAENSLAITHQEVTLFRQTTTTAETTPEPTLIAAMPHVRGDLKRTTNKLLSDSVRYNSALVHNAATWRHLYPVLVGLLIAVRFLQLQDAS